MDTTFVIFRSFVFYYAIGFFSLIIFFNIIFYALSGSNSKKCLGFDLWSIFLIQLPLLFAVFASSLIICELSYTLIFISIGFIGMAAEAFYSYYWVIFFNKANWIYTIGGILRNFTSIVNFLAWGGGFMMFLGVMSYIFPNTSINEFVRFSKLFLIQTILIHLLLVSVHAFFGGSKRKGLINFSLMSFITVSLPIIIPLVITSAVVSMKYIAVSFVFGVFTFVCEYLYGKYMRYKTGKKLWYYNYDTIDDNHTSYTNIPGGITAGYLFVLIFLYLAGFV